MISGCTGHRKVLVKEVLQNFHSLHHSDVIKYSMSGIHNVEKINEKYVIT